MNSTDNTTDEQETELNALVERSINDFFYFAKHNLKIRNKKGKIVPLALKPVQVKFANTYLKMLYAGVPIRILVLKARKEGISTVVAALYYWHTTMNANIETQIIAHDDDSSKKIYEMYQRFHSNSAAILKPQVRKSNKKELTFATPDGGGLNSMIEVKTAGTGNAGRGSTPQFIHASEASSWPNPEKIVSGLFQAVPLEAWTAIVVETTAQGMGDWYHREWLKAKTGDSIYTPLFFAWHDDPEYRIPIAEKLVYDEEEKKGTKAYGWDDEQINWRRYKIKEIGSDLFKQEFPANDTEAFLASGRPRFELETLMKWEQKARKGRFVELIEDKGKFRIIDLPKSPFQIYEEPIDGEKYSIAADVAEGLEKGDYSVLDIQNMKTLKTVGRWRGHIEPGDLGDLMAQIGAWYNMALLCPESNNHGIATIQRLRDHRYPNIYRRERGFDQTHNNRTLSYGWATNVATKPLMIDNLAIAIRNELIIEEDIVFIREAMSYVIDDKGKTNAQQGSFDDTVIAKAINLQLVDLQPVQESRFRKARTVPQRIKSARARAGRAVSRKRRRG